MKPATRIGDYHTCPATAPGHHVGGPIVGSGCAEVQVEQKPAARGGDIATCAGATDVIMKGSGTVLIGGMPAARVNEVCLHAGGVTTGATEVLVGGPTVDPPNIDQIVRNVREIDRRRERMRRREELLKNRKDYIRCFDDECIPKPLKKVNPHIRRGIDSKDVGPGGADFVAEEADTLVGSHEDVEILEKALDLEKKRIQDLETEIGLLQQGQSPPPTPVDPEVDAVLISHVGGLGEM